MLDELFADPSFEDDAPANTDDWTTARATWRVTQIAHRIGVDPRTVRSWCEQGILVASTTPGGHYRVAAADLRTWLNGHAAPLTAAA